MSQIAIIDDNLDQSATLKRTLNIFLKRLGLDAKVIDHTPFRNPEDYFPYINENNVTTLILDERLNEVEVDGTPVDYKGNQLVGVLRERLKDFPIYMITAHAGDEELMAKEYQFEQVINRKDITTDNANASNLAARLARSSQRFVDANNEELIEFTSLSTLMAQGKGDEQTQNRIKVLQAKLELPISAFDDRKAWLDRYEEEIGRLEQLRADIIKKIGSA